MEFLGQMRAAILQSSLDLAVSGSLSMDGSLDLSTSLASTLPDAFGVQGSQLEVQARLSKTPDSTRVVFCGVLHLQSSDVTESSLVSQLDASTLTEESCAKALPASARVIGMSQGACTRFGMTLSGDAIRQLLSGLAGADIVKSLDSVAKINQTALVFASAGCQSVDPESLKALVALPEGAGTEDGLQAGVHLWATASPGGTFEEIAARLGTAKASSSLRASISPNGREFQASMAVSVSTSFQEVVSKVFVRVHTLVSILFRVLCASGAVWASV